MAEILELARDGIVKTQIMYQANLSFAQLNDYLGLLLHAKLLKETNESGKTLLRPTRNGIRFLQNYYQLRNLLSEKDEKHTKAQQENASNVVTPNSKTIILRINDLDTRLRLIETRLSDFLIRNGSSQYCPYCGNKLREHTHNREREITK